MSDMDRRAFLYHFDSERSDSCVPLYERSYPLRYETNDDLPDHVQSTLDGSPELLTVWREAYNASTTHRRCSGPGDREIAWKAIPDDVLERAKEVADRRRAERQRVWDEQHRHQQIRSVGELRTYLQDLPDSTKVRVSNQEGYGHADEADLYVDEDAAGPFLFINGE